MQMTTGDSIAVIASERSERGNLIVGIASLSRRLSELLAMTSVAICGRCQSVVNNGV